MVHLQLILVKSLQKTSTEKSARLVETIEMTELAESSEQYGALSLSRVSIYVQALLSLVFIRGN